MKKRIESMTFDQNNMPQALASVKLEDCIFTGAENALNDSRDIILDNCVFMSPKALCAVEEFKVTDSRLLENESLHHANKGKILDSDIRGAQALRQCCHIALHNCAISSPEFGWKCHDIVVEDCNIHASYLFHESRNVRMDDVEVRGDFSFQYMDTLQIGNSFICSNEVFRHCKNVTVVDSVIQGGCIGWYSENLTLIGCKIIGAHPLCHCKNLKLIDCILEQTGDAFEGSDVRATIVGHLASAKNPLSGRILADSLGQVSVEAESTCEISLRA